MSQTRIYLVRHGQVEGFESKRYNGQGDVPLTGQGRAQFEMLRMRLEKKEIAAVYGSDLGRCVDGAKILAAPFMLEPVFKSELRELHIGEWEGHTWHELQSRYPDQWQARLQDIVHYRVPGGESLFDMSRRVRPVIKEIVAAHKDQEIILVAHGGVNRVILLDAIGAPLDRLFHIEQDYGCLNIIDYYGDGISVVKLLNG